MNKEKTLFQKAHSRETDPLTAQHNTSRDICGTSKRHPRDIQRDTYETSKRPALLRYKYKTVRTVHRRPTVWYWCGTVSRRSTWSKESRSLNLQTARPYSPQPSVLSVASRMCKVQRWLAQLASLPKAAEDDAHSSPRCPGRLKTTRIPRLTA